MYRMSAGEILSVLWCGSKSEHVISPKNIPEFGRWMSVEKDGLPKEDGDYIVCRCFPSMGIRGVDILSFTNSNVGLGIPYGRECWYIRRTDEINYEISNVTHWMLKPELPKEDTDAGDEKSE